MTTIEISQLSDNALIAETKRVAEVERRSMAELLTLLIEVERRELCEQLGYPSLFAYCMKVLGLSEQAAYSRITAARAVRRFPAMLPMLGDGALTLSSVGLLAPHLTEENHEALLEGAKDRSTRDVQKMIAHVHTQPDVEPSLRALPSRAVVAPLAPKRYLLKVTIGQETHDKLQRATARRSTGRVGARSRPMRLHWTGRAVHVDLIPRVPSRRAVRCRRTSDRRESSTQMPKSQRP